MRKKLLKIITATIDLIVGTAGAFILNIILNTEMTYIEKVSLGIFLLSGIFIVFLVNEFIFSKIYDKCWWLRLIFTPQEYIEGTWVQIIDDNTLDAMPPTKYTIITIKIEDCVPIIYVNSYNQKNGKEMVHTKIPYSTYNYTENKLDYHYKFNSHEFDTNKQWIGYAELVFSKTMNKRSFNKYSGLITSNLPRKNEIRVKAFKQTKKIKLENGKKVKISEISIKEKEVRDYIDNYIREVF